MDDDKFKMTIITIWSRNIVKYYYSSRFIANEINWKIT